MSISLFEPILQVTSVYDLPASYNFRLLRPIDMVRDRTEIRARADYTSFSRSMSVTRQSRSLEKSLSVFCSLFRRRPSRLRTVFGSGRQECAVNILLTDEGRPGIRFTLVGSSGGFREVGSSYGFYSRNTPLPFAFDFERCSVLYSDQNYCHAQCYWIIIFTNAASCN